MDAPSVPQILTRGLTGGRPTSSRTVRICHAGIRALPRSFAAYMKRDVIRLALAPVAGAILRPIRNFRRSLSSRNDESIRLAI
jgi:hypothetical protein